ncbi:hypothetical protein P3T76_010137 [Phytophthora citrophthora]|uniref:Uncharacterized protein n=1 Tax=Phytophthora citrophthora TaxID=4793 RepID=A0AAD9GE40_9STRA|nr:hypothetical protein P3T76_010137 [Phytophthora citrophthora]
MEKTPSEFLLDQVPRDSSTIVPEVMDATPLRELIQVRTTCTTRATSVGNTLDENEDGVQTP